jgi:hypothetical protein
MISHPANVLQRTSGRNRPERQVSLLTKSQNNNAMLPVSDVVKPYPLQWLRHELKGPKEKVKMVV